MAKIRAGRPAREYGELSYEYKCLSLVQKSPHCLEAFFFLPSFLPSFLVFNDVVELLVNCVWDMRLSRIELVQRVFFNENCCY